MTYAKKTLFSKRFQVISSVSRALSHPARLKILDYLAQQEQCVSGDISEKMPLSRPTVSQHLQELKKAGLIKGVVSGRNVYYCLDTENIKKMEEVLCVFLWELASRTVKCEIESSDK